MECQKPIFWKKKKNKEKIKMLSAEIFTQQAECEIPFYKLLYLNVWHSAFILWSIL